MKKNRRQFTPTEKVAILRRHFLESVPVSGICDENNIHPTIFYRWQKEFFENGKSAFERKSDAYTRSLERKKAQLEEKIAQKDEIIAEIMEDHVKLKKTLGEI